MLGDTAPRRSKHLCSICCETGSAAPLSPLVRWVLHELPVSKLDVNLHFYRPQSGHSDAVYQCTPDISLNSNVLWNYLSYSSILSFNCWTYTPQKQGSSRLLGSAWGSTETMAIGKAHPTLHFFSEKFEELQCILLCSILFLSYWNVYIL